MTFSRWALLDVKTWDKALMCHKAKQREDTCPSSTDGKDEEHLESSDHRVRAADQSFNG